MRENQCMTSKSALMNNNQFKTPLVYCLLAAFLPLGSTFGVVLSWIVFPCIAICLTILKSRRICKKGVYFFFCSTSLLLLNYGIVSQYASFTARLEFNLLLAIIGCFYMSMILYSNQFNFSSLARAIDIVLIINITFFLVQFFSYYVLKHRIDYSILTGGVGTRNDYGTLFRASGIFNEPAEYSSAMSVLVVIRFLTSRKLTKLSWLSAITTVLSFSFVGIFQSLSIIFVILSRDFLKRPKYLLLALLVVIFATFAFYGMFIDRYTAFIDGSDGSNNTKVDTINFFLVHTEYLFGGAGLIGYDPATMPLFLQGLYDLTFFGSSLSIFGIIIGSLISIFVALYIIYHYSISDAALIFICLLKINVMIYAMYWFFIIMIFIIPRYLQGSKLKREI